jgi:hypothetical protein
MTAMLKSQRGLSDLSLLARSQLWANPFCFRSLAPHLEQVGRSTTQETDRDEDPYRPLEVGLRVRRPSYERRGLPGLRRGRRHQDEAHVGDAISGSGPVGAAADARIRFREVEDNDELLVRIVHQVGDPHLWSAEAGLAAALHRPSGTAH